MFLVSKSALNIVYLYQILGGGRKGVGEGACHKILQGSAERFSYTTDCHAEG